MEKDRGCLEPNRLFYMYQYFKIFKFLAQKRILKVNFNGTRASLGAMFYKKRKLKEATIRYFLDVLETLDFPVNPELKFVLDRLSSRQRPSPCI